MLYIPREKRNTLANKEKYCCRKVRKRKPTNQKEKINGLDLYTKRGETIKN